MKILVSAYACEPDKGSEPGVAWDLVREISKRNEVTVITRSNNRSAIETNNEEFVSRVSWLYADLPKKFRFWKKGGRGTNLYYLIWQFLVYRAAIKEIEKSHYDLVHHVTFGRYWMPVGAAFLNKPFVFGPVGGGEESPASLNRYLHPVARAKEMIRSLLICGFEVVCKCLRMYQKIYIALAATPETASKLKRLGVKNIQLFPQCGITEEQYNTLQNLDVAPDKPFRVISIGRLIPMKGFHIGILAFAEFHKKCPESEYLIINTGPEEQRLRDLCKALGIQDKVHFLGRLPNLKEVYRRMGGSHVLLHPALHEAFGNVCLEAMAAGLPVVCLRCGGPALQVTEETGFSVPCTSDKSVPDLIAEALLFFDQNRSLAQKMGRAGAVRAAQEFGWRKRGEDIQFIYEQILKH